MQLIATTVSQLLLAIAVPYFLLTCLLGVRVARKQGSLRAQERSHPGRHPSANAYQLYFLVPCLNEALVIGPTVHKLLADERGCRVVVIDDASNDDTALEARLAADTLGAGQRLRIVTRRRPQAQLGKGEALNAGLAVVVEDAAARQLDPAKVVVAVMDADGRLSPGGAAAPLPLFDDERVGAVQLIVRIRNRAKLICKFQDVEFWLISAVSQFARSVTGTVSLGGNAQFTRLSALFSLGLRLAAKGWRTTTTARAYVDQQGVESYRRLLRQRTRWYQGHMTCLRRLPELWASDRLSHAGLIELTSYLLVPWAIVLPWSVLQQWVLYQVIFGAGRGIFASDLGTAPWLLGYALLWYAISFLPNLIIGIVYWRRTRAVSLPTALLLGHMMIVWNYIGYVAAWRGVVRMARGRVGWVKTPRTADRSAPAGLAIVSSGR